MREQIAYNSSIEYGVKSLASAVLNQALEDYKNPKLRTDVSLFFQGKFFDLYSTAAGIEKEKYLAAIRNLDSENTDIVKKPRSNRPKLMKQSYKILCVSKQKLLVFYNLIHASNVTGDSVKTIYHAMKTGTRTQNGYLYKKEY